MEDVIACNWDQVFVLTEKGYNHLGLYLKKKYKVGMPRDGFERSVPKDLFDKGFFEIINESDLYKPKNAPKEPFANRTTIALTDEQLDKLMDICEATDKTMCGVIRDAICFYHEHIFSSQEEL